MASGLIVRNYNQIGLIIARIQIDHIPKDNLVVVFEMLQNVEHLLMSGVEETTDGVVKFPHHSYCVFSLIVALQLQIRRVVYQLIQFAYFIFLDVDELGVQRVLVSLLNALFLANEILR